MANWRRVAWGLAALTAAVAAAAGAGALYIHITGIPKYAVQPVQLHAEVTPERVRRGHQLVNLSCAGCHLNPETHQLTGKLLMDVPEDFGTVYSANITAHPVRGIGAWSDGDIARLLRTGLRPDGQYIPIYMPKLVHMSDEDLLSIIAFLRSNDPMVQPSDVPPAGKTRPSFMTKALSRVAFKPMPYPTGPIVAPPPEDKVAYGRYLVHALDCYACHSSDFKKLDMMHPEHSAGYMGGGNTLLDMNRQPIHSANLTFDVETGIGAWSEGDFARAMRKGIRPDHSPLHYPMVPMPDLSEADTSAIYAYLGTVPRLRNQVVRVSAASVGEDRGKTAYRKYGCPSCHGESGLGTADLRQASKHLTSDDSIRAWIKNAPSMRPGVAMPAFDGVIEEQDYEPLVGYVKRLGD